MSVGVLIAVAGKLEPALVRELSGRATVSVARRCGDTAELMAAAAAGIGGVAVLSAARGDIDLSGVAQLRGFGVRVLLLAHPDDIVRTSALGADDCLPLDTGASEIADAVVALAERLQPAEEAADSPAFADTRRSRRRAGPPAANDDAAPAADAASGGTTGEDSGVVVAIWGPPGSHGRSTVAAGLAHALGALGSVVLIDGDIAAPALSTRLGILEDVSGLATLARRANQGRLSAAVLAQVCQHAGPFDFITGIGRAERWREVSAQAIGPILGLVRAHYAFVVVDVESVPWPQADAYDRFAPDPARIRAEFLAGADRVLHVAQADTSSMHRLIEHLDEAEIGERDHVVVTAVRAAACGSEPSTTVLDVLSRFTSVEQATLVPDDRRACDDALLHAAPVPARSPRSALSAKLRGLAADVAGRPYPQRRRGWARLVTRASRQVAR